jgi:thiol-disulfide isomerase/thioredoxin
MTRPSRGFLWGCLAGGVLAWVVPFALLLAASLLAPDFFARMRAGQLPPPPLWRQAVAPLDWPVETPAGTTETLASHAGSVLILHFWRPGCLSCRAELPGLNALHAALAGTGARLIGVAMADFDEAAALAASGEVAFPVYLARQAPPPPFDLPSSPVTFILAPSGAVAFRHAGAARWDAPEVLAFIQALGQTAQSTP